MSILKLYQDWCFHSLTAWAHHQEMVAKMMRGEIVNPYEEHEKIMNDFFKNMRG